MTMDEREGSGEREAVEGSERAEDARGTPAFFEYWNRMDFVSWMGARIVESWADAGLAQAARLQFIRDYRTATFLRSRGWHHLLWHLMQ